MTFLATDFGDCVIVLLDLIAAFDSVDLQIYSHV